MLLRRGKKFVDAYLPALLLLRCPLPSFSFSSSSIPPFLRHLPRLRPLRRSSCRWSNAAPATAKATPAMCSAPNGLGKMIKLRPKVKILRSVTTMPAVVAPNSGRRKQRVVRACLWGGWVNFRIVRCVLTFEVEMYRDLFVSLSLFLSIFISLYLSIFPLFFSSLSLLSLSLSSLSLFSLSSLTLHKLEHDAKAERIQSRGTDLGEEAGST